MSVQLRFSLPDTLELAEHALTAPHNRRSFSEQEQSAACPGALMWVKDDGTCLMSGGAPRLRSDPADPDSHNKIVYAEGRGPGVSHDLLAAELGGDDFVEHLHLRDGGPALIDLTREARQRGCRWLLIVVHPGTFHVGFRAGP